MHNAYCILLLTIGGHIWMLVGVFLLYQTNNETITILIDHTKQSLLDIRLLHIQRNGAKSSEQLIIKNKQQSTLHKTVPKKTAAPINHETKKGHAKKTPSTTAGLKSEIKKTEKEPLKPSKITKNISQDKNPTIKKPCSKEQKQVLQEPKPLLPPQQEQSHNQEAAHTAAVEQTFEPVSPKEVELLKKINELQKELTRVWHPPVVQKAHPSCTLDIFINWSGAIESITIKESSGILLFDAAARKAAYDMHIPVWAKGKSITITLKA